MRDMQDRFDGRRIADALDAKRRYHAFWDAERALIAESSFFFIASSWGDYVDCSIKSGRPGFVQVTAPGRSL